MNLRNMWWGCVLKVGPVQGGEELVAHKLLVAKPAPGRLEQTLHHRPEVLRCVLGKVNRDLGVPHDVGVSVDDRPLQVGEGRGAVEHLVDQDAKAPVVALHTMAVLTRLKTLQYFWCDVIGSSHRHYLTDIN